MRLPTPATCYLRLLPALYTCHLLPIPDACSLRVLPTLYACYLLFTLATCYLRLLPAICACYLLFMPATCYLRLLPAPYQAAFPVLMLPGLRLGSRRQATPPREQAHGVQGRLIGSSALSHAMQGTRVVAGYRGRAQTRLALVAGSETAFGYHGQSQIMGAMAR